LFDFLCFLFFLAVEGGVGPALFDFLGTGLASLLPESEEEDDSELEESEESEGSSLRLRFLPLERRMEATSAWFVRVLKHRQPA
jgi:hypothetical protein